MKRLLAVLLALLVLVGGAATVAEESSSPAWAAYDALIAEIKAETDPSAREALMH